MKLTLPALAPPTGIEAQNVLAAGVVYAAYELEQLKLFTVADRIVELSQRGMLPLSRATASRALSRYAQNAANRLTESERRTMYARALGKGSEQQGPHVNREFSDLWMRFVSAVSAYQRESRVRQTGRSRVRQVELAKRARDLASNLSLHAYGIAYYAALELQNQINTVVAVVSLGEIRSAFGARDMWQVIEHVAAHELGGAVNTARYRTLATSGLEIIRWLARGRSKSRPTAPGRPLVKACEAWLAAESSDE
jgi:hypothetical protein